MLKRITMTAIAALALALPGVAGAGLDAMEQRVAKAEQRFAKVCESKPAKARCATVAAKIAARMDRIEARIAKRTARLQERCASGSTAKGCRRAAARLASLQALNARAEALEAKARAVS